MPIAAKKQANRRNIILGRSPEEILKVLRATAGLWKGRKINPIAYQRKMRKLYSTKRS